MHLGIVGGLKRAEPLFRQVAATTGHTVEFHQGHVGGRGSTSLDALVSRSELLVVQTDVNSHGSVLLARKLAKQKGVRLLLVRRLGLDRFETLLGELDEARALRPLAASF